MTQEIIVIDKAKADDILKNHNSRNRKIQKTRVRALAEDMKAGRWNTKIMSVLYFFGDGELADGQHRLAAVSESDAKIPFVVVKGIDYDDVLAIDKGKQRSTNDVFSIMDKPVIYRYGSIISTVRLYFKIYKSRRVVSDNEIMMFIDDHTENLEKLYKLISVLNKTRDGSVSYVSTGFLLKLLEALELGFNFESLMAFCKIINTGKYADEMNRAPEKNTSALVARNQMIINNPTRGKSGGEKAQKGTYQYFDKPLHDFIEGTPRRRVYLEKEYTGYFTGGIK